MAELMQSLKGRNRTERSLEKKNKKALPQFPVQSQVVEEGKAGSRKENSASTLNLSLNTSTL